MDDLPCTLLIPAAGHGVRFKQQDIEVPKGLLRFKWRGQEATMIEHCIPHGWCGPTKIICRYGDRSIFKNSLVVMQDYFSNVWLQTILDTDGQSHTVAQGALDVEGDILIINSDNGFDISAHALVSGWRDAGVKAAALVFKADDKRYGYVNDFPWFEYGIEKTVISNYALAGAFYFDSASTLINAFLAQQRMSLAKWTEELYLSGLFKYIAGKKQAFMIEKEQLHEWGTPELLKADPTVEWTP